MIVLVIVLLGFLLIYPLFRLFWFGLSSVSQNNLLNDGFFWSVVQFTYTQAIICTVIAGLIGIGLAIVYSDWALRGRAFLWNVSLIYFILPSILVVNGLVMAWGSSGYLSQFFGWFPRLYGWSGIIISHVLMNFSLFFRAGGLALREFGREPEMVALSLGASRWQVWKGVTWPRLRPTIYRTALISFVLCSSSFLVVLLMGGSPRFTTIEVAIYQAVRVEFDPNLAAKLTLFQLCVGLVVFFLLRRIRLDSNEAYVHWVPIFGPRTRAVTWMGISAVWLLAFVLILPPMAALFISAISSSSGKMLVDSLSPLWGSVKLASFSGVTATLLALLTVHASAGRSRRGQAAADFIVSLPLVISTVVLSLSWMVAYRDVFFRWRGSLILISIMQSLCVLPVIHRLVKDSLERVTKVYLTTAHSLGATSWQSFLYVSLPLMRPALVTAFVVAAGFSLSEVGTLLMVMDESVDTLPLAIYRRMAQYRFGEAGVLSGVLLVSILSLFFISSKSERWQSR